jgi:uncharacterized membrane protein
MRDIFEGNPNPTALLMALLGIVYFTIGFLFSLNIKYSKYLGLIFTVIELATGFGSVVIKNWIKLLFAIDAVVAICCVLLIPKRVKT